MHKAGVGCGSLLSIQGSLGGEGCQHLDRAHLLSITCMLTAHLAQSDAAKRVAPACELSRMHFYTFFLLLT